MLTLDGSGQGNMSIKMKRRKKNVSLTRLPNIRSAKTTAKKGVQMKPETCGYPWGEDEKKTTQVLHSHDAQHTAQHTQVPEPEQNSQYS